MKQFRRRTLATILKVSESSSFSLGRRLNVENCIVDLGEERTEKSARRLEDAPSIAGSELTMRSLEPAEETPCTCVEPGGMIDGIKVLSPVLAAIARQAMR